MLEAIIITKFVITLMDAFNIFRAPEEMEFPIFFNMSVEIEEMDSCNTPKSISNFDEMSVRTADILLKNNTTWSYNNGTTVIPKMIRKPNKIKYIIPTASHFGNPQFSIFLQYGYRAYDTANATKNGSKTFTILDKIPSHKPFIR